MNRTYVQTALAVLAVALLTLNASEVLACPPSTPLEQFGVIA